MAVPSESSVILPAELTAGAEILRANKILFWMIMMTVVNTQNALPGSRAADFAEVCCLWRSQLLFAVGFRRSEVKPGAVELINSVFRGSCCPAAGMANGADVRNSFGEQGAQVS